MAANWSLCTQNPRLFSPSPRAQFCNFHLEQVWCAICAKGCVRWGRKYWNPITCASRLDAPLLPEKILVDAHTGVESCLFQFERRARSRKPRRDRHGRGWVSCHVTVTQDESILLRTNNTYFQSTNLFTYWHLGKYVSLFHDTQIWPSDEISKIFWVNLNSLQNIENRVVQVSFGRNKGVFYW